VLDAEVDYASRVARVRYDPARVDVARLRQATADAGYPSEQIMPPAAVGQ
jgi:copper chaperone CopZ